MRSFDILIVYPDAFLTLRFFKTLAEDTLVTTLCWYAMRSYVIWLDQVYPFQKNVAQRIILQVPAALVINCGLLLMINETIQHYYYQKPTPTVVYTHHIWVYAIWTLLQNAIYITLGLLRAFKSFETTPSDVKLPLAQPNKLAIKLGNKEFYVAFSNISYCTVTDHLTAVHTNHEETFIIEKSLDQLTALLPAQDFFRVNRQFIIHKSLVKSLEKQENGKVKLCLKEAAKLPPSVSVSRIKAPSLKKWLKQQAA